MGDGGVSKTNPGAAGEGRGGPGASGGAGGEGAAGSGGFIINVSNEAWGGARNRGGDIGGGGGSAGAGRATFRVSSVGGRSWLFWPASILGAGLVIILIALVLAIVIPVAMVLIVLGLIRRWIGGFFPVRAGNVAGGSGGESMEDEDDFDSDLRRNVRVIGRDGREGQ